MKSNLNNMNSRVKGLTEKLKALYDRGVGGEKENALKLLQQICDKYNLVIDDILENDPVKDYEFLLNDDIFSKKLFNQVASTVLGDNFSTGRYKYKMSAGVGQHRYYINCKSYEFLEIIAKFDFYYREFKSDFEFFFSAFIQKNSLYPNNGDPILVKYSEKDRQDALKVAQTSEGLDRKVFNKQIDLT